MPVSVQSKPDQAPAPAVRRLRSQDLFQHLRELEIDHEGRIYRLRLTQLNKLILTA
ncbi:MAG: hemin uptake protein HemP [Burkholderiaceae bacterium]